MRSIMKSSLASFVNVLTIQKGHEMDANNNEIRRRKEWEASEMKNDPHY